MTVIKKPRRTKKKTGKPWQTGPYSYQGLTYIACSEKDRIHHLPEPRLDVIIDVSKKEEDLLSLMPDQICKKLIAIGRKALGFPKEVLLHEVEPQCLDLAIQLYQKSDQHLQNAALTESFLDTISMICKAIVDSGEADTFQVSKKQHIVSLIKDMLTAEPVQTSVRNSALITLNNLSNVKPSLSAAETNYVISLSVKSILSLPQEQKVVIEKVLDSPEVPKSSILSKARRSVLKTKKSRISFNTKTSVRVMEESLFHQSMTSLEMLLIRFLEESPTAELLRDMMEVLQAWLSSEHKWERERAMRVCYVLLLHTNQNISRVPSACQKIGYFLGILVPYTKDSSIFVRDYCLQSLSCLVSIQHHVQGRCGDPAYIVAMEPADISQFVWKYLYLSEVQDFLRMLLKTFDYDGVEAGTTAAVWFGMVLDQLGSKLRGKVQEIIRNAQNILPHVRTEEIRNKFLQALQPLATHQPDAVVQSALNNPFPSEKDALDFWTALGSTENNTTAAAIVNSIIDMMSQEDQGLATEATFGFNALLKTITESSVVNNRFAEIFCSTLRSISLTLEDISQSPTREDAVQTEDSRRPCRIAVDALKNIILKANIENGVIGKQLAESSCWALLSDTKNHTDGVILLTRLLIESNRSDAKKVIKRLLPLLSSPSLAWRLTGLSFLSEVLGNTVLKGMKLTKKIIQVMNEHSSNTSDAIRAMAMRALGRVATFSPKKAKKYKGDILRPLLRGLHGEETTKVMQEIFSGLDSTLKIFTKKEMGKDFHVAAVQSRFLMDARDSSVRASAIELFGRLGSITKVTPKGFFAVQFKSCLGILLSRMQDPDINVFMASVNTIKCCLPFLGSKALLKLFESDPIAVGYNHQEFLERFFVPLHQELPELLPLLVKQCMPYCCSTMEDKHFRDAARDMMVTIEGVMKNEDVSKEQVMQLIASCHTMEENPGSSGDHIKKIKIETSSRQVMDNRERGDSMPSTVLGPKFPCQSIKMN